MFYILFFMSEIKTIGDISEMFSITADTLRYYEKTGVIPPIKRDENGRRVFSEDDIKWLGFVNCLKLTEMPLDNIRKYLELLKSGDKTAKMRREIIAKQKLVLGKRINELNTAMNHLDNKLKFYDDLLEKHSVENF